MIVDETHRIYKRKIVEICKVIKDHNTKFIFSIDEKQVLSKAEMRNKIYEMIKEKISVKEYSLTTKIRTNKQMAAFIKNLQDLSKINPNMRYDDVEVMYCNTLKEAVELVKHYKEKGYTFINYTGSNFTRSIYDKFSSYKNAHAVIGQEFDNVMVLIDWAFRYNGNQLEVWISAPNPNYLISKMFYQQITRVRDKLCILVFENHDVFQKILSIILPKS